MKVSHGINVSASEEFTGMFPRLFLDKDSNLYDREGDDRLAFAIKAIGDEWVLAVHGTSHHVAIRCDRDGLVNKQEIINFLTEAFVWV